MARRRSLRGAFLSLPLLAALAPAPVRANVDEAFGEATQRVPILTPAGTAGTGPDLALEYRSGGGRGGAGWIGLGWELAGASEIRRDTRQGVPFDYEAHLAGASCGGAPCYREAYALDGQELICDQAPCQGRYRTRRDDGRLIRYERASDRWQIRDRDGTLRSYGATASTRIANPRNGQTFSWLLERVEDVHGNWISYAYDHATGVAYLSRIEYAQARSPANRSVDFIAAAREDRAISYLGGFRRELDRRLVRIDVRAEAGALVTRYTLEYAQSPDSGRSLLARVQRLGADEATPGPPYTATLPPWSFAYTENARSFADTATSFCSELGCPSAGLGDVPYRQRALLDLNGDALLDAYDAKLSGSEVGVGNGIDLPPTWAPGRSYLLVDEQALVVDVEQLSPPRIDALLRDMNGDPYPDWLQQWPRSVRLGTQEALMPAIDAPLPSGPSRLTTFVPYLDTFYIGSLAGRSMDEQYAAYFREYLNAALLDMNGDGRPDRVWGKPTHHDWDDNADEWLVALNLGTTTDGSRLAWSRDLLSWKDPIDDAIEHAYVTVLARTRVLTIDINGDGLPDRVERRGDPQPGFVVAYNNGTGFDAPEPMFTLESSQGYVQPRDLLLGSHARADFVDLNGDGFLDFVRTTGGSHFEGEPEDGWMVNYGTGSGLRRQPERFGGTGATRDDTAYLYGTGNLLNPDSDLADFDGDGLLDSYARVSAVYLNQGPVPDLLARAISPRGGEISFRYAGSAQMTVECEEDRCTRSHVCAEGACASGPAADEFCLDDLYCGACELQAFRWCETDEHCQACVHPLPANPGLSPSRPVVVETAASSGRPGDPDVVTGYHYARGVFDYEAREFRGFGSVTRTLLGAGDGAEVVSGYATDRACEGRLLRREHRDREGPLRVVSHAYEVHTGPSASAPETWSACLLASIAREVPEPSSGGVRISLEEWDYGLDPEAGHWNPQVHVAWGEVDSAHANLSRTDDRHTFYAYAEPLDPESNIVARVSRIVVRASERGPIRSHTKLRYDGLPHGDVGAGLLTRRERLRQLPPRIQRGPGHWVADEVGYDAYGNATWWRGPATASDPDGYSETRSYDETYRTRIVSETRGADAEDPGLTTTRAYSGCAPGLEPPPGLGLPCVVTDPRGRADRFGYDALGRRVEAGRRSGLIEQTTWDLPEPGGMAETLVTRALLLAGHAPLLYEEHRDGLGRAFRSTSPGKTSERIRVERSFDARGRLASETVPHFEGNANPRRRELGYDALDRVVHLLGDDGTTTTTWNHDGWTEIEQVYSGEPSPANRLDRSERTRDGRGRLVEVARYEDAQTPAGRTALAAEYDALDRLTRVHDAIGSGSRSCDPANAACPGQSHATRVDYDTLGYRARVQDSDRGSWRFEHDDAGLLTRRIDGALREQRFEYDTLRRVVWRRFVPWGAGSSDARLDYGDEPGRDDYGRLVRVTPARNRGTFYEFAYDAAGRVIYQQQRTFNRRFERSYGYDELGRPTTQTFPDGEVYDYVYDGVRLEQIRGLAFANGEQPFDVLMGAEYDALGRTTRLDLGDTDATGGTPAAVLERSYDPATGRLATMTADGRSTPGALQLTLAFDGLGRLTSMDGAYATEPLSARSFDYDGLGRLTEATGPWERPAGEASPVTWSYAYDALGNLTRQTSDGSRQRCWQYGHAEKPRFLTELSDCHATIDQIIADSGGHPLKINGEWVVWNAQHLLHWSPPSGSGLGSEGYLDNGYVYDVFDRRTGRDLLATDVIYVGDDFTYDTTGNVANKTFTINGERLATRATRYELGDNTWSPPAWVWRILLGAVTALAAVGILGLLALTVGSEPPPWLTAPATALLALALLAVPGADARSASGPSGGPSWLGMHLEAILIYATDHLGSTRVVLDGTGASVERRDYDPFGRTIRHVGDFDLAERFTGMRADDVTGLQHHGARPYDPEWSRFLSPDEALESFDADGLNPYAYARNQPTSRVDRDGHQSAYFVPGAATFTTEVVSEGLLLLGDELGPESAAGGLAIATGVGLSLTSVTLASGLLLAAVLATAGPVWVALAVVAGIMAISFAVFGAIGRSRRLSVRRATSLEITVEGSDLALPVATAASWPSDGSATVARFRQPRAAGQGGPMGGEAARSTALTYYFTGIWLNVSGL